jgi:ribosome-associated protein
VIAGPRRTEIRAAVPCRLPKRTGASVRHAGAVREIRIRDEMIRLGQFLKLADLVESGGDLKPLLAEGLVKVNDEVETRRGRQLTRGDVVTLANQSARVG